MIKALLSAFLCAVAGLPLAAQELRPPLTLALEWKASLGQPFYGALAAEGEIVAARGRFGLPSVFGASGQPLWRKDMGGTGPAPVICRNAVLCLSTDGDLE
jgi:hypothetical protein